jgi:hypothetical protein
VRVPWAKSIILIGSHAIGSADENVSDFDIVVVLKSILVPIFYLQLKNIEREVNARYNCKVSINPLPTFRLKQARDNYFLFKLAKRGVVLWGEDILPHIDAGSFRVTDHVLMSYLSFLAKELIANLKPLLQCKEIADYSQVLHTEKKVLIGCAEMCLLMRGIYEDRPSEIMELLKTEKSTFVQGLGEDMARIYASFSDRHQNIIDLWFRCRNHVLKLLVEVLRRIYGTQLHGITVYQLALHYVSKSRASPLRNLQYLILSVLNKKRVNFRLVFTTRMITSILYASAITLLASIERHGIREESLHVTSKLLGSKICPSHQLSIPELCLIIRNYILDIWQLVDVHMGF